MLKGVDNMLLKIPSFCAVHSFHQMHFLTFCHIFFHSTFLTFDSGIWSCQEAKRETTEIWNGAEAVRPLRTKSHTNWEKTQSMKIWSIFSVANLHKQQRKGPFNPRFSNFSLDNTLLCMSNQELFLLPWEGKERTKPFSKSLETEMRDVQFEIQRSLLQLCKF